MLLPLSARAQDCCGPGGGGGAAVFDAAENAGAEYRLKNARRYAYSMRHPGFTAGLEAGGITDRVDANLSPHIEYSGSFGSIDLYAAVFYSAFFGKPHSHQLDAAVNVAWRLAPDESSRLVFRLDAEDLAVFFPDDVVYAYAAREPGVSYSRAFWFGDLSLSLGFPVLLEGDGGLNSYATLGYEHPIGLGVSARPRLSLIPDAEYSGSTLTLTFAWDTFFVKAAFIMNGDSSACNVRPYLEYTAGHVVLWGGVEFDGLGETDVSVNPFLGAGYNF
jgi:hypothetical protein